MGVNTFELLTDHKPLVPLLTTKDLDRAPPRCQRLLMRTARFNALVRHVPGKNLIIADCLSRSPLPIEQHDVETANEVETHVDMIQSSWPISDHRQQSLQNATSDDSDLQMVIKYCKEGWPTNVPSSLRPYQKVKSEVSLTNGLVTFQDRIAVPSNQRKEVLQKLHESHQGFKKCLEFAKLTVFWPGIRGDLRRFAENCQTYQENRPAQT